MKKIIILLMVFSLLFIANVKASLPLSGKVVIIDPGHGGMDAGTSYQEILEKDINLDISLKLEKILIQNGASVILTRDGDYDLSSPSVDRRKKSDFDNRINLINNSNANLYLSIHTNYLTNKAYSGGQVFYYGNNNKKLAESVQREINTLNYAREIKPMPNVYMYKQLKIPGVLIEVGFLSNEKDRTILTSDEYQSQLSKIIVKGIINYYN